MTSWHRNISVSKFSFICNPPNLRANRGHRISPFHFSSLSSSLPQTPTSEGVIKGKGRARNWIHLYSPPNTVNMVDAKSPAKKAAKPKAPAAHPPVAAMVKAAVKALKERNGSSLPAIKKYIAANYKVDIVKLNRFINKALKNMTEKGVLTKVKGSYKLSAKVINIQRNEK